MSKSLRPSAPSPARLDPARDAVNRRLARQVNRFPDLDIKPIDTDGLSARDAAFAHALDEAVTRRWLTLTYLLNRALTRPFEELEPKMRAALLSGAAQLLFMDKVPSRAAVHESVEWAKRAVRPRAAGMVNAALRGVQSMLSPAEGGEGPRRRERWSDRRDELPLSDGGAIELSDEILPTDPLERLSVATSNPVELLRMWLKSMSMREVKAIALHGLAHAPTILNTAHVRSPLPGGAGDAPPLLTAHAAPGHHVFHGGRAELVSLLRSRDDLWVQDPASSLAVASIVDLSPGVVIDVCAGRGTKTRQLAAAFPEATIVATDVDAARYKSLEESFQRSERVQVAPWKGLERWFGQADLVMLDVPCSNTGVLARRIEARYRVSEERTAELAAMQRQIIADAIRLPAPGGAGRKRGRMLYSSCSLDRRENEAQVEWATRWHGFEESRVQRRLPTGGPGEPPEQYSDGSFSALLG